MNRSNEQAVEVKFNKRELIGWELRHKQGFKIQEAMLDRIRHFLWEFYRDLELWDFVPFSMKSYVIVIAVFVHIIQPVKPLCKVGEVLSSFITKNSEVNKGSLNIEGHLSRK